MSTFSWSGLIFVYFVYCQITCVTGRPRKRSDDTQPLASVVEQLVQRVNTLEADKSALEADVSSPKTKLAAKRCESGTAGFNPHIQDTIVHSDGGRVRIDNKHITFSSPFSSPPVVTAGLITIDAEHTVNTRIRTTVTNVLTSGFDISVDEWGDSYNYGIGLMWMACS